MSKEKFRFHWGHGIVLTFVLFAAFMAFFYVKMSQQKIDLVGDHYYEDGQKFQEKLNILAETKRAKDKIEIRFNSSNKELIMIMPENTSHLKVDLFFPGDARKDKHFSYPRTEGKLVIPLQMLTKGKWKLTISYKQKGKPYLEEITVQIP